jgi:hypothetical protein
MLTSALSPCASTLHFHFAPPFLSILPSFPPLLLLFVSSLLYPPMKTLTNRPYLQIVDPASVPKAVAKERPAGKKSAVYVVRFFPAGD